MSQKQPATAEATSPPSAKGESPRSDWIARGMLLLGILLLGSLLVIRELPKWYQAAALVHRDRGEFSQAVASLNRAVAYDDANPGVYKLRANLTLQAAEAQVSALLEEEAKAEQLAPEAAEAAAAERRELLSTALEAALVDYNKSLELFPDDLNARLQKAEILQRLGRHEEAVAECHKILEDSQIFLAGLPAAQAELQKSKMLNMLAYTRARGNLELEEALEQINEALDLLKSSGAGPANPITQANYLDTRGVILYRLGRYNEALVNLDAAVTIMGRQYSAIERQLDWERQMTQNQKSFDEQKTGLQNHLAVMLYHRGQAYEAIGRLDFAERDFNTAKQYGYSKELGIW